MGDGRRPEKSARNRGLGAVSSSGRRFVSGSKCGRAGGEEQDDGELRLQRAKGERGGGRLGGRAGPGIGRARAKDGGLGRWSGAAKPATAVGWQLWRRGQRRAGGRLGSGWRWLQRLRGRWTGLDWGGGRAAGRRRASGGRCGRCEWPVIIKGHPSGGCRLQAGGVAKQTALLIARLPPRLWPMAAAAQDWLQQANLILANRGRPKLGARTRWPVQSRPPAQSPSALLAACRRVLLEGGERSGGRTARWGMMDRPSGLTMHRTKREGLPSARDARCLCVCGARHYTAAPAAFVAAAQCSVRTEHIACVCVCCCCCCCCCVPVNATVPPQQASQPTVALLQAVGFGSPRRRGRPRGCRRLSTASPPGIPAPSRPPSPFVSSCRAGCGCCSAGSRGKFPSPPPSPPPPFLPASSPSSPVSSSHLWCGCRSIERCAVSEQTGG